MDTLLDDAVTKYKEVFGSAPSAAAFAPGRVNLIGEHVDYNDGFVLPFALPFRTIVVGSVAADGVSKVISLNMEGSGATSSFTLDEKLSKGSPSWANYVKGTAKQYLQEVGAGAAFNAVVVSNVPIGSGLSSSASLEVAVATLIETLFNVDTNKVTGVEKALRCQKAEHTFADTPCGIMDQYISANGRENALLLLDCRSNTFELVPFGTGDGGGSASPVLVVCNSRVKHQLSGSEYPVRVRQCREAVALLQGKYPAIQALRDVSMEQLLTVYGKGRKDSVMSDDGAQSSSEGNVNGQGNNDNKVAGSSKKHVSKKKLKAAAKEKKQQKAVGGGAQGEPANEGGVTMEDVVFRRARHCIGEDERTLAAVKAIQKGDWDTVGKLMTASHHSLQHDYEVSCPELDFLVDSALTVPGVLGSRMTGGGFGGCTISLCANDVAAETLMEHLRKVYPAGEVFSCGPSEGCGVLSVKADSSSSVERKAESSSSVERKAESSSSAERQAAPAYTVMPSSSPLEDIDSPDSSGTSFSWLAPLTGAALVAIAAIIFMRRKN